MILLNNGSVAFEGTWDGLTNDQKHVLKFTINEGKKNTIEQHVQMDNVVRSKSLKVDEAVTDLTRATGDMSLYGEFADLQVYCLVQAHAHGSTGYYLQAVGPRNLLLLIFCTASYSLFVTFPQYWLQKWTEAPVSQTMFYIGGYLISSLLAWTATNGSMW